MALSENRMFSRFGIINRAYRADIIGSRVGCRSSDDGFNE